MFHSLSSTASHSNASQSIFFTTATDPAGEVRPRATGRTQLCLNQVTTHRQTFAEDVLSCVNHGISRIGLWRQKIEQQGTEVAVELISRYPQLTVSSLSWGGGFTGGSGLSFHEAVEDTRAAIYLAREFRSHTLQIVTGSRWGHIQTHARRLLMDGLSATVDIAAEHGVTLALQPMAAEYADGWTFLDSLDLAVEVVNGFAHPFLGLALGTCHLWQQPRVLEKLEQVAPLVANVQLSDWQSPRCVYGRCLPGDGEVDLPAMVAALQRGGYQGDFEIDVWSSSLWKSDVENWLGSCVEHCNSLISASAIPGHPDPHRLFADRS